MVCCAHISAPCRHSSTSNPLDKAVNFGQWDSCPDAGDLLSHRSSFHQLLWAEGVPGDNLADSRCPGWHSVPGAFPEHRRWVEASFSGF